MGYAADPLPDFGSDPVPVGEVPAVRDGNWPATRW